MTETLILMAVFSLSFPFTCYFTTRLTVFAWYRAKHRAQEANNKNG